MKPYYQDEYVTIYHGDCREILPQLDMKVDLVLTDPPYGNDTGYGCYEDSEENLSILVETVMPLLLHKTDRALITCGVANIHLYPRPRWILSWAIPAGAGVGPWGYCCWQPVLAYGTDPYLQSGRGRRPDTLVKYERASSLEHPCAKPLDVWKWLLARGSAHVGETVLDPFLGSGTTAQAAKALYRKCIGIEIEERYCEIAARRCDQSVLDLFGVTDNERRCHICGAYLNGKRADAVTCSDRCRQTSRRRKQTPAGVQA